MGYSEVLFVSVLVKELSVKTEQWWNPQTGLYYCQIFATNSIGTGNTWQEALKKAKELFVESLTVLLAECRDDSSEIRLVKIGRARDKT